MSQAKSLVKFVQKQLEIPFFQFVVCDQVKNRKTLFLCSGDIQQKAKFKYLGLQGDPIPSFTVTS